MIDQFLSFTYRSAESEDQISMLINTARLRNTRVYLASSRFFSQKHAAVLILFVGLGNPGAQYAGTRHNVGQWALEKMASEAWPSCTEFSRYSQFRNMDVSVYTQSPQSQDGNTPVQRTRVLLAKTNTYMNVSGEPVAAAWQRFQAHAPNPCLVIVHDDVEIPLGKVRVRQRNTSAKGHNGLRSIDLRMGGDYVKIGIGIGKAGNLADFVLGRFLNAELEVLSNTSMPQVMQFMDEMVCGQHLIG